jgi:hypothetical protein
MIFPGVIGYGMSSSLLLYADVNFNSGSSAAPGSLSPVIILPRLWFKEGIMPPMQAIFEGILFVVGIAVIIAF